MTRTERGLLFGVIAVVLAGLAALAVAMVDVQQTQRDDVEERFANRAETAAAMTQAIFGVSGTAGAQDTAKDFGADVSTAKLDRQVEEGSNAYVIVVDRRGKALGASTGTPQAALDELAGRPDYLQAAFTEAGFGLSNLLEVGDTQVEHFAQGFPGADGPRALVSGIDPGLIAQFIGGFLAQVPGESGGSTQVIDSDGMVLASTDPEVEIGSSLPDRSLAGALADSDQGTYGSDRWFTKAPIVATSWSVVSNADEGQLFASVSGAEQTIPWLIFAALAAAALVAIEMLRRTVRSKRALAEANGLLGATNSALASRAEELERAKRELERSNSELEQFASVASHDLREPLRKIRMFTDQIERTEAEQLSERGVDYLQRMSGAAERMDGLIQDLLAFSRVSTRGRAFEPVDLRRAVDEAVDNLEAAVSESGAVVEIDELPTVDADPVQMMQLMQNLVGNAIKFHRDGVPPEVRIAVERANGTTELTVTDNGIGFEPQYAARIFRVFERLHEQGEYPGTGIGLALCRKIVERHGGTIVAESEPGKGARFIIRMPTSHNGAEAPGGQPEGAQHASV